MAHAQKPDFVFRRNTRVHLNRRGASVQSTTGSRGVRISGSNAGYTTFRGSVKSTGYTLHSLVSPSPPLPCRHVPSLFNWALITARQYPVNPQRYRYAKPDIFIFFSTHLKSSSNGTTSFVIKNICILPTEIIYVVHNFVAN